MLATSILAIDLSNQPGSLATLAADLAADNINMYALLAPSGNQPVLLAVNQVALARVMLKQHNITFRDEPALVMELGNRPGQLADIARRLNQADIPIRYTFATVAPDAAKTVAVIGVDDSTRAMGALL